MKKRILVACGSGVATSTVIASRIREICKAAGIDAYVEQVKIVEVASKAHDFDLIVASTKVPTSVKVPSVSGVSYLTGIGAEKTDKEIVEKLKQ
jgi:PTS system galactitol-specific IIB component